MWEEVILHLPDEVRLVSLSATVSNAEEFGGWIQTVRGDTTVVVDEHRPVPLWQHVLVGKRLFDLFDYGNDQSGDKHKPRVDPELLRPHRTSPRSRPDVGLATAPPRYRTRSSEPAPVLPAARTAGRHRDPGLRGAAAGDHLHLFPGRL